MGRVVEAKVFGVAGEDEEELWLEREGGGEPHGEEAGEGRVGRAGTCNRGDDSRERRVGVLREGGEEVTHLGVGAWRVVNRRSNLHQQVGVARHRVGESVGGHGRSEGGDKLLCLFGFFSAAVFWRGRGDVFEGILSSLPHCSSRHCGSVKTVQCGHCGHCGAVECVSGGRHCEEKNGCGLSPRLGAGRDGFLAGARF